MSTPAPTGTNLPHAGTGTTDIPTSTKLPGAGVPAGDKTWVPSGKPTGVRPPGWAKIFATLVTTYTAAYIANCVTNNIPPEPLSDSILEVLEHQTDNLLARYQKEFAAL